LDGGEGRIQHPLTKVLTQLKHLQHGNAELASQLTTKRSTIAGWTVANKFSVSHKTRPRNYGKYVMETEMKKPQLGRWRKPRKSFQINKKDTSKNPKKYQ
jgi:hypothetical protein